jgi:glycosyltransferase involved in cell wall biosynthesis
MKTSIITVCFNSAATIEDAIKSILMQDYKDIEYIVVDGGSTDGTLEILAKYQSRIAKCISEPDNGIYDAMNKGIKLATGDIIGFLNSDDFYVDKTVIRRIAEMMMVANADCCYGNLEYVDKNDINKTVRRWKSQPYCDGLFEKGWHPPHPTFFVKKNVFDNYGGFDLACDIGADYELMLRFLKRYGITSCYIPDVLVKMRIGGKSNRNLWQIIKANIECYQAWKKNGLKITPLIMLKKPVSKLIQYLKRD